MTTAEATRHDASAMEHSQVDSDEQSRLSLPTASSAIKLVISSALLWSALSTYQASLGMSESDIHSKLPTEFGGGRRRLASIAKNHVPGYMKPIMEELRERKKLFEDTPPEEVKYWFEYAGPLQVSLAMMEEPSFCCTIAHATVQRTSP